MSENKARITGKSGRIVWGYFDAATIGEWSMKCDPTGSALTAAVVTGDEFRLTQEPLVFVVPVASGEWRFPVQSLLMSGTSLTAQLGLLE